jgi:hypothetical protein
MVLDISEIFTSNKGSATLFVLNYYCDNITLLAFRAIERGFLDPCWDFSAQGKTKKPARLRAGLQFLI